MNRIDHTSHAHPATPAARKACRKATRATEAATTERKAREERFDADMARLDASKAPQPITIRFTLKSGETCRVLFDQYQNASLFVQAQENGWDRTRTVNQAISEAIHGVFEAYGIGSVANYKVEH